MKVLEIGNKIIYRCHHCNCVLEIDSSDWLNSEQGRYIFCPMCGKKISEQQVIESIKPHKRAPEFICERSMLDRSIDC